MVSSKKEKDPVYDIPMLYEGLFDYLVYEADLERVISYHNHIKDFFTNSIIREAIVIANQRVKNAKQHIR